MKNGFKTDQNKLLPPPGIKETICYDLPSSLRIAVLAILFVACLISSVLQMDWVALMTRKKVTASAMIDTQSCEKAGVLL